MNSEIGPKSEALPGYTLLERLGAGGYGEVWRASAPGGLEKAIKLVFGTEHEKRAVHEMKALQRIKELRHPFLLSLERIEVVDGRLLVVTELADSSLKDRFDEWVAQGQPGIPRDELIGYLREAADALDYMMRTHRLQHLDIKPENLLIVAGHVKVADFGLVKDVQNSQASIVGGMTPLYSAPEVFRGQPGPHSDQYSLAILYQEMLSGCLPFAGSTIAELTLQHLNDAPDLAGLQSSDRYIVARALSKDPQHRYPTCREFVQALEKAADVESSPHTAAESHDSSSEVRPARLVGSSMEGNRECRATEIFDEDTNGSTRAESILIDLDGADTAHVRELGPVSCNESGLEFAPTLFLGIGGAGGLVLQQLRRKLLGQFGSSDRIPAVRLLLLDTDSKNMAKLATLDQEGLAPEEMLALPLRRPQHYREHSSRLLQWLSRRWLYNIPRSMQTEGLRPLGRLAFVDHARQACQRIRKTLAEATAPESVAATAGSTGFRFSSNACRVYIVTSVSGGTGSGMSLDVSYAVRAALAKMGIGQTDIVAILLHTTGRDAQRTDLARVNAYAWLNEYQHFLRSDRNYPGDASCGLPAHAAGVTPFDSTYLLHLGDGLVDEEFQRATHAVADYLQRDALSPARQALAQCRRSTGPPSPSLRSFGIHVWAAAPDDLVEPLVDDLCAQVVYGWRSHGEPQAAPDVDAAKLAEQLQLSLPALAGRARTLIGSSLPGCEAEFLRAWLSSNGSDKRQAITQQTLETVDRLFHQENPGEPNAALEIAQQSISSIVAPLAEQLRQESAAWLRSRVDQPDLRLEGAQSAGTCLSKHLQQLLSQAEQTSHSAADRLHELRQSVLSPAASSSKAAEADAAESSPDQALAYFRVRLEQCALIAVGHLARLLLADVRTVADQFALLGRELKHIETRMGGPTDTRAAAPPAVGSDASTTIVLKVRSRLGELAPQVDRLLQEEFLDVHRGLLAVVLEGGRVRAKLLATLRKIAERTIHEAVSEVNVLEQVLTTADRAEFQRHLDAATPALLKHGGSCRLLAMLPRESSRQQMQSQLDSLLDRPVTTVAGPDNTFALCVEAEELPLAQVAVDLLQRRRDHAEFAERVHSRNDIRWTKITDQVRTLARETERDFPVTMPVGNVTCDDSGPAQLAPQG